LSSQDFQIIMYYQGNAIKRAMKEFKTQNKKVKENVNHIIERFKNEVLSH
jgi:hypothetical protein